MVKSSLRFLTAGEPAIFCSKGGKCMPISQTTIEKLGCEVHSVSSGLSDKKSIDIFKGSVF